MRGHLPAGCHRLGVIEWRNDVSSEVRRRSVRVISAAVVLNKFYFVGAVTGVN